MTSGFPPFCKNFTHKLHTWDCRPPSHWIQLINDVNILQTVDKARAQQIRVHWNDLKRWTSLRSQRMCIRPATRGPLLSSSRINCYLYFFKLVLGELLSGSVVFVFFKCIFFWAESHQQSCISSETSVTRFVLPALVTEAELRFFVLCEHVCRTAHLPLNYHHKYFIHCWNPDRLLIRVWEQLQITALTFLHMASVWKPKTTFLIKSGWIIKLPLQVTVEFKVFNC